MFEKYMFEKFEPLNTEVNAFQFDGKNGEGIVKRCTGDRDLEPVPEGLEVLGFTQPGVLVKGGYYHSLKKGDWILEQDGQYSVMSNPLFVSLYQKK